MDSVGHVSLLGGGVAGGHHSISNLKLSEIVPVIDLIVMKELNLGFKNLRNVR